MGRARSAACVVQDSRPGALNVLFVTGSLYSEEGGPFHSLLETVRKLQAHGHSTLVIGTKDRVGQSAFPGCWPNAIAFEKLGPYSWHYSPQLGCWMKRIKEKIDVVSLQSVWSHNNYLAAKWCVSRRVPYMITSHGNFSPWALSISKWKKHIAKLVYVNYVLKKASCLHALNEAEYENIRGYGLKQPVCIVPNGANLAESRRDITLEATKVFRTCLYLGRLHPIKNLDTLIRAWHAAGSARKGWKLELAGPDDGGYREVLENLVSSLGLDDVRFPGSQNGEAKELCFRRADCFVLPSLSEGASVALLEALSYGLPALITDRCNLTEAARADAAIEVTPSLSDLQIGLTRMLRMTEFERGSMGAKARQLIETHYQWTTIAADLAQVYSWLVRNDRPPSCVKVV